MYFTRLWVPVLAVLAVVRDTKLLAGVAVAACLLVAPVASAVVYDFEGPTYVAGDINGQDGWTRAGTNTTATVITTLDGDQILRIGRDHSASHSLVGSDFEDVMTVTLRTYITDNGSYAELQLFDSANVKYAHIGFQNNPDHFYIYNNAGYTNVDTFPVAGGNYYNVEVTLDFANQKYSSKFTHEIFDEVHSDSGFVNFVAPTTTALAEGGTISLFGGTGNNSNRYANFDYVSIVPATTAVPGDYNGNGSVDSADYIVWRKNQGGAGGSASVGDSEPDNDVDTADYDFWRARFGNPTSGSGSSAQLGSSTVPEPASAFLMALGTSILTFGASRRRHR